MDMVMNFSKKKNQSNGRVNSYTNCSEGKFTKNKKLAGDLKPEFYIALCNSHVCVNSVTNCFNMIIQTGDIPRTRSLNTLMILKKQKFMNTFFQIISV